MAEQFGNSDGDQTDSNKTGFNTQTSDQGGSDDKVDITPEQLAELRRRDEAAQAHIKQLEGENGSLREEKSLLANELASSTTLEDVMARLNNEGTTNETPGLEPDKVAEIVDQRLQQKTQQQIEQDNWAAVESKLIEVFKDWDAANSAVEARASELKMTTDEATTLAVSNPVMFSELFLPKGTTVPQQSTSSAATSNSQSLSSVEDTVTRDKAYYSKMMREDKNKYWSVETQKQMRRDLYGM